MNFLIDEFFDKTFLLVINMYAPIKIKILKSSHVPYGVNS